MTAALELGRDAVRRHAWADAMDSLSAADNDSRLAPADLELLGTAAWWAGHPDDATDALERAFAGHEDAGRSEDAARIATVLAYQAFRRLAGAVGGGWVAQAHRLLEGLPDSPLHAFIGVFQSLQALMEGRIEAGIELADQTMAMARQRGNTDALYSAMSFKGMAELMAGRWQEGLALTDEAAAAASSGRLELRVASDIYCTTIAACRNLGDLQRAGQWTEEAERWMRRQSVGGYPGICQVHRAELKMLRGHWSEAEQDARQACTELERYGLMDAVGFAQYQVGEIRLRMGDLEGAAEAFDRAYEFGHDAMPGLALLQLERGDVAEAQRAIARALAAASGIGAFSDRATLGRLLPAQVDIALAARDLETAGHAVEELESIAADFDRPLFQAGALTARGELLLGDNKPTEASPILGQSWRLWRTNDLPYESARARVRYAEALAAQGDAVTARRDLLAARAIFERLGATLDLQRVDGLLAADGGQPAPASRPGERATKTFMFTDIVTSTDLVGVIGDEAWNELLGWHDRELRSAVAQHRGQVVNSTGDGFFVAFEHAADAIDSAIDIERRLVRHRREHGFAPFVRIGLHMAEATRRGRDYSGQGVHVAARVGAAAGREEILATSAVLAEPLAPRFKLSEPRILTLKGVREPVEVRSVDWR
jgi:class 3 adenylate cyclase